MVPLDGVVTQSEEEAISLFTLQDENGQVDSAVPLTWCVSNETAQNLQSVGEKPYLLIVIEQDGYEMDRDIVPLTAQMCYVRFTRPGENVIHATIVWRSSFSDVNPQKLFLEKDDFGQYKADILERPDHYRIDVDRPDEPRIRRGFDYIRRLHQEAKLGVVVPEEMFAKKPMRLTRWLGNLYIKLWERPPRDPCSLRRRAIFTAVTLPLVAVSLLLSAIYMYALLVLNAIALAVSGKRDVRYRRMFSGGIGPKEAWDYAEPSVWWYKKKVVRARVYADGGEKDLVRYQLRHPAFFAINPPAILGAALVGLAFSILFNTMLYLVLAVSAVFLLGLLIVVATLLAKGPVSRLRKKMEEKGDQLLEQQKEALTLELEQLTCNGQVPKPSLAALPRGRRTVALRYDHLKAKVCKPFAR